jgi:hypothetical protein
MNCILLAFLVTNALFWSLFPHSAHCKLLGDINKTIGTSIKCPSHMIHIIMGIVFFLASIFISQKDSPHFKKY